MTLTFTKATAHQSRLRLALIGPAGSGKTYTALNVAQHLGSKVAVIDTERGSASKYASLFGFDVLELTSFAPQTYVQAIQAADAAGYDVLVIDSLSHAWMGKDGALEMVDRVGKRSPSGNSFAAWRDVTPHHNAMVDAILGCRAHVVVTLRSKTEYVQEKDERTGKTVIRKVGLAPIQREGLDFEFDVCGDLDYEHNLCITKSRCPSVADAVIPKPGKELAEQLRAWLGQGEPAIVQPAQTSPHEPAPSPKPVAQPTNGHGPQDDDDEPTSVHTADTLDTFGHALKDALDEQQVPAPAIRFPNTPEGQRDFIAACEDRLGLDAQGRQEALGGSVAAYIKAREWKVTADQLDRVFDVLKAKVDDNTPVPNRIEPKATAAAE